MGAVISKTKRVYKIMNCVLDRLDVKKMHDLRICSITLGKDYDSHDIRYMRAIAHEFRTRWGCVVFTVGDQSCPREYIFVQPNHSSPTDEEIDKAVHEYMGVPKKSYDKE